LEDAALLELFDIAAAGGAVLNQTRRIVRERIEKFRQFPRVAGRDIHAEPSFD
jgi:hypothetical protein